MTAHLLMLPRRETTFSTPSGIVLCLTSQWEDSGEEFVWDRCSSLQASPASEKNSEGKVKWGAALLSNPTGNLFLLCVCVCMCALPLVVPQQQRCLSHLLF